MKKKKKLRRKIKRLKKERDEARAFLFAGDQLANRLRADRDYWKNLAESLK